MHTSTIPLLYLHSTSTTPLIHTFTVIVCCATSPRGVSWGDVWQWGDAGYFSRSGGRGVFSCDVSPIPVVMLPYLHVYRYGSLRSTAHILHSIYHSKWVRHLWRLPLGKSCTVAPWVRSRSEHQALSSGSSAPRLVALSLLILPIESFYFYPSFLALVLTFHFILQKHLQ